MRTASLTVGIACLPLAASAGEGARPGEAGAAGSPQTRWLRQVNDLGLYPRLGSIHDGSGPAPGAALWVPRLRFSGLDLYAATARSFHGDELMELRLGRVPAAAGRPPASREALDRLASVDDRWFLYANVRHRGHANDSYFASDPGGGGTTRHGYSLEDTAFEIVGGYRLRPGLVASMRAGWLRFEPGAAGIDSFARDAPANAFTTGRADYFRVGAELAHEGRDRPSNPHRGHFLGISAAAYADRSGRGQSFSRVTVDGRKYQPLGSDRHVLAVRALGTFDQGASGGVPFYLQETLGGKRLLRAYPSLRFRGERVIAFSAEYRFEPMRALELAAFYDAGVASGAPGGDGSGLRSSYGLGLRLKRNDHVLIRVDAARGAEGSRVRLAVGAAF